MTRSEALSAYALGAALVLSACGAQPPVVPGREGGSDAGAEGVDAASDAGPSGPLDSGVLPDGGVLLPDGGTQTSCLPVHGTGLPLVTNLSGARRLASDGTHLYMTVTGPLTESTGRVLRIPLVGGVPETLADDLRSPDSIAAEAGVAFVLEKGGLWRIDAADGTRKRIDTTLNNALLGETTIVLDGDALFYSTGYGTLVRVNKDGTDQKILHTAPSGSVVRGLSVVGDDVVFLVALGPDAGLYRVPKSGASQAVRIRDDVVDGHYLHRVGDRLLVSQGTEGQGSIRSLSLDAQDAQELITNLTSPGAIAYLDGALYFKDATSTGSQAFFRALGECGVENVGAVGVGPGDLLQSDGVLFFTSQDLAGTGYLARLP